MGLKDQIKIAQNSLSTWPEWARDSVLTVKGAMLVADATMDDGSDIHRHALKILADEVRRLRRVETRYQRIRAADKR